MHESESMNNVGENSMLGGNDDTVPIHDLAKFRCSPQYNRLSHLVKLASIRSTFRNWPVLAALSTTQVVLRKSPLLLQLGSCLSDIGIRLKTQSGVSLLVPVRDVLPAVEVFALRDYDLSMIKWETVKSVVDCGANVGAFTLWASQRSSCQILSVEPNPRTFVLLEQNVAHLAGRISLLRAAVAGRRGTRTLYEMAETSATSFFGNSDIVDGAVEVRAVTLGDVLAAARSRPIDLLKIDIEGAEREVFDTLDANELKVVHVAIIECHGLSVKDVRCITEKLLAAEMSVATEHRHGTGMIVGWR
jgi:FkbM family methyltransferase